jgi:hypothetical protein
VTWASVLHAGDGTRIEKSGPLLTVLASVTRLP